MPTSIDHRAMLALPWNPTPEQTESLAICLDALQRSGGPGPVQAPSYRDWVVELGLGALITAAEGECPASWPNLARDIRVEAASNRHGLLLRDMHPPDAAVGLSRSAEFALHFDDSYAPLIRRALAHGQPVLAWRGWDAPGAPLANAWGVIVGEEDERGLGRFVGFAGSDPARRALLGPAHQLYVLETRSGTASERRLSVAELQRVCAALWEPDAADRLGVLCGAAAYDALLVALDSPGGCCCGQPRGACVIAAAQALATTRSLLAQYLTELAGDAASAAQPARTAWIAALQCISDGLRTHDLEECRAALATAKREETTLYANPA